MKCYMLRLFLITRLIRNFLEVEKWVLPIIYAISGVTGLNPSMYGPDLRLLVKLTC